MFCRVQVSDSEGQEVPSQVNVWWDHRDRISTAKYEVRTPINKPDCLQWSPILKLSVRITGDLGMGCHIHYKKLRMERLNPLRDSADSAVSLCYVFHQFLSCFIFQLIFVAKVPPLGLTTYFISSGLGAKLSECSSITEYNSAGNSIKPR